MTGFYFGGDTGTITYILAACSVQAPVRVLEYQTPTTQYGFLSPCKNKAQTMPGLYSWWRYGDSNPGPLRCQRSALSAELYPRNGTEYIIFSANLTPPLYYGGYCAQIKTKAHGSLGP